MKWFRDIGPGVLIAAAFIGPGTVTLCTIAGASFGYSLIWAIILSIFSTLVLQEMSLRIGLITKMNLAQVIRINIKSKFLNRLLNSSFKIRIYLRHPAEDSAGRGAKHSPKCRSR